MSNPVQNYGGEFLVSVVMPTRNRQDQLLDCLEHLNRQTFSSSFEVIVVDDCSPVPIVIPQNYANFSIKITRTTRKSGPGPARNVGIALATGRMLAFTDDDCRPEPDWIEQLWTAHLAHPGDLLGGKITNAVPEYLGAEASQVISDIVYAWYNSDPASCRFFSTNNVALARSEFLDLHGFGEQYTGASEDRDLCDRWRKSGRIMRFVPQARIGHAHKLTLKKFTRQHFSYGRGAAVFHNSRAQRKGGSIIDEMPFHKALPRLAWKRLAREPAMRKVSLTLMLGIWQAANAAGYAWERMQTGRRT